MAYNDFSGFYIDYNTWFMLCEHIYIYICIDWHLTPSMILMIIDDVLMKPSMYMGSPIATLIYQKVDFIESEENSPQLETQLM